MKTRFLSFLIMIAFALTLLAPTPAYAQPAAPTDSINLVAAAGQTTASLTVNNVSGGRLTVTLSGPKSYYFTTNNAGKSTFTGIEPGTYKITLSASTCTDTVTVNKKLTGKVALKETVCAQKAEKSKSQKMGSLTVDNRTGGTLYVYLTGPKTYSFSTANQGKATFDNIEPGKYTITVRASACGGSLTYNKNITGKTSLKAFVCR